LNIPIIKVDSRVCVFRGDEVCNGLLVIFMTWPSRDSGAIGKTPKMRVRFRVKQQAYVGQNNAVALEWEDKGQRWVLWIASWLAGYALLLVVGWQILVFIL